MLKPEQLKKGLLLQYKEEPNTIILLLRKNKFRSGDQYWNVITLIFLPETRFIETAVNLSDWWTEYAICNHFTICYQR